MGKGAKIIEVRDANHAANVRRYIAEHADKEGAWVWINPNDEERH